ncbi:UNVERIFIED_CONTAM: hypothetical protein HDU68_006379, partial [Siphonaria sp. JEL0065]
MGLGLGKGGSGAKRHCKILSDNTQGITKPAMMHEETCGILRAFLWNVLRGTI